MLSLRAPQGAKQSSRLWLFGLCFSVVFMVGWISTAQAADPLCNCFCTDPRGGGVRDVGGKKDFAECDTFCKSQESKIVVCAQSFSQLPGNSLRCFTEEQCTAQNGYLDSEQAPECPTGMTLCLPNDVPVNLIVSVPVNEEAGGMVGTVNNIGDYINTMYKFLLWAGGAFAIIMLMAGGLQYVLSSGTGNVKQAQGRIRQAVIGLVLLMGAYVILLTINPNLVKLSLPKLPLVKRVEFLGAGKSCETLLKEGYKYGTHLERDPNGGPDYCGNFAKIILTPDGKKPPDGSTCAYTRCETVQEACIITPNAGSKCLACASATAASDDLKEWGLVPSRKLCAKMSLNVLSQDPRDQSFSCAYSGQSSRGIARDYLTDVLGGDCVEATCFGEGCGN